MRLGRSLIILIGIVSLVLFSGILACAQEESEAEISADSELQWVWGEVVSLDAANQQILIKYFDYENDTEKEMNINVDGNTTYENAQSIEEIKPADTVSIDYMVGTDGKNIAKNISIEKAESTPGASEEANPEAMPELEQIPALEQE